MGRLSAPAFQLALPLALALPLSRFGPSKPFERRLAIQRDPTRFQAGCLMPPISEINFSARLKYHSAQRKPVAIRPRNNNRSRAIKRLLPLAARFLAAVASWECGGSELAACDIGGRRRRAACKWPPPLSGFPIPIPIPFPFPFPFPSPLPLGSRSRPLRPHAVGRRPR